MDEVARAKVSLVAEAFHGWSGPAKLNYPESGWWFAWEGKDIAKALLDLDPDDIEYDDVIQPMDGSFVPAWTTNDGLLWLVPGMIRVVFEVDSQRGDRLIQAIYSEFNKRILDGDLTLTRQQMEVLLDIHETFYCSEAFNWNPSEHNLTLCDTLRRALLATSSG